MVGIMVISIKQLIGIHVPLSSFLHNFTDAYTNILGVVDSFTLVSKESTN